MSKARAETKTNNHQESPWAWIEVRHQNTLREAMEKPQPPRVLVAPERWGVFLGGAVIVASIAVSTITNNLFHLLGA